MFFKIILLTLTFVKVKLSDPPAQGPAPTPIPVKQVTAFSPWASILEEACNANVANAMCQFKDLLSTFSHWKVKKLKGQPGSEVPQTDACDDPENSKLCNTGHQVKSFYKKFKMTLDNSKLQYSGRFPEDLINGWSQNQLTALFKGIEKIPDRQQLSGFQADYYQTDQILQLTAQVRLLSIRFDDFKIGSQMYAAFSLGLTLTILIVYTAILSYVSAQKCRVKLNEQKLSRQAEQERRFRKIISREREQNERLFELE